MNLFLLAREITLFLRQDETKFIDNLIKIRTWIDNNPKMYKLIMNGEKTNVELTKQLQRLLGRNTYQCYF